MSDSIQLPIDSSNAASALPVTDYTIGYILNADHRTPITLGDVVDSATIASTLITSTEAILRAALAIPVDSRNAANHYRAIIEQAVCRLEFEGGAFDSEVEELFRQGYQASGRA